MTDDVKVPGEEVPAEPTEETEPPLDDPEDDPNVTEEPV
jgi:hypothetical protein